MKKLLTLVLVLGIAFGASFSVHADEFAAWAKDLPDNHWAKWDIKFFKGVGYLDGVLLRDDEPTIDPEKPITRAEFVSLINLIVSNNFLNEKEKADFEDFDQNDILDSFSDVDSSHWAKKHISWAVENVTIGGYLNGKGSDKQGRTILSPDANITRQEAMTIMSKVMMQKKAWSRADENAKAKIKQGRHADLIDSKARGSLQFNDTDKIAKWALPFVEDCFAKGIVKGNEANNIEPTKNITRAEALKMLKNVTEKEGYKVGK